MVELDDEEINKRMPQWYLDVLKEVEHQKVAQKQKRQVGKLFS
ncbi:MAG: hypothetical protein WC492_03240 [Candidatus Micrarchaeia archaeon]